MPNKRSEADWENWQFPKESALQTYVLKRLRMARQQGIHFVKIADRFTSGISDLIGCVNGRFVAIELKVGSNRPTSLQLEFLAEIKRCGGVTGVAYTWGEVKNILKGAGFEFKEES